MPVKPPNSNGDESFPPEAVRFLEHHEDALVAGVPLPSPAELFARLDLAAAARLRRELALQRRLCQQPADQVGGRPSFESAVHSSASTPVDESDGADPAETTEADGTSPRIDISDGSRYPQIDGFELLGELGRGGMSVVYKARQVRLGRIVAIKMILAGGHAGPDRLERFRTEAAAVARLRHPHIVQVYDFGEQHGQPYLVLEFVEGGSLHARLGGKPLPPRDAAELARTLALAVQHAHEHNVVHRDLKPANVLLQMVESGGTRVGSQETTGQSKSTLDLAFRPSTLSPKIADFGLAKQLDADSGCTQSGTLIGTPSYMAPEQAAGHPSGVGPPADVYALGAVLYELLTGRPPFQGPTTIETLEQVRNAEPLPPHRLQPRVPFDLETICLKCLEKEPARRYGSATELANDLDRWLVGEPIAARRSGRIERAVKWARRRPAIALLSVAVLAAVLLGVGGVLWQWRTAVRTDVAHQGDLYFRNVDLAYRNWQQFRVERSIELLNHCPRHLRRWEWQYVSRLCGSEVLALPVSTGGAQLVAYSHDGQWLAAAGTATGEVQLWRTDNWHRQQMLADGAQGIECIAFSPDGARLAAGDVAGKLFLWETATGKCVTTVALHARPLHALAFSPDGERLVTGAEDGTLLISKVATGCAVMARRQLGAQTGAVAFSPNGRFFVAATGGTADAEVIFCDTTSGDELKRLTEASPGFSSLAFSPDGTMLAAGKRLLDNRLVGCGDVIVWDTTTGEERRRVTVPISYAADLKFTHDGSYLVAVCPSSAIVVWDVRSWSEPQIIRAHQLGGSLALSPDGRFAAAGSMIDPLRLWDITAEQSALTWRNHEFVVRAIAFSPTADALAVASDESAIVIRNPELPESSEQLATIPNQKIVTRLAFSPDGRRLAWLTRDYTVHISDASTGAELELLPDATIGSQKFTPGGVAFSSDGSHLAASRAGGAVTLWDMASADSSGKVHERTTLVGHGECVTDVAFSPDGHWLATASEDQTVRLWDVRSGVAARVLNGHEKAVNAVSFDPSGRLVASAGTDRTIRI